MKTRSAGGESAGRVFVVVAQGASLAVALAWIAAFTLFDPPTWLPWVPDRMLDTVEVTILERIANIVLFAPLGAVLGAWWPRRWPLVWIGTAVSVMVELAQLGMTDRTSDVGDVVMNTLGTALGFAATVWVHGRAKRHSRVHPRRSLE
ncbi:MAG: VanZ family protein [Nitriliruptoraceae bacterium]